VEIPEFPISTRKPAAEREPSGRSLISIILCARNRAGKLSRALCVLGSLSLPQGWYYEIIVVDNGSTDETLYLRKIS
jgi:glycosyltransferase involved in cell wall biosynthesis